MITQTRCCYYDKSQQKSQRKLKSKEAENLTEFICDGTGMN